MIFFKGPAPHHTTFLSETLILVSSIPSPSMARKSKCFFDGKNSIFEKNKVEIFKNRGIFQHMFYTGNTAGK